MGPSEWPRWQLRSVPKSGRVRAARGRVQRRRLPEPRLCAVCNHKATPKASEAAGSHSPTPCLGAQWHSKEIRQTLCHGKQKSFMSHVPASPRAPLHAPRCTYLARRKQEVKRRLALQAPLPNGFTKRELAFQASSPELPRPRFPTRASPLSSKWTVSTSCPHCGSWVHSCCSGENLLKLELGKPSHIPVFSHKNCTSDKVLSPHPPGS